jgi:hypothetical protein
MYLVGHAAVGVAFVTAAHIKNPVAAFGVGWLSHYVADFFPHGDEAAGEWAKKGKSEVRRILALVAVDATLLLAIFAVYLSRQGWSWPVAAAIAGSALPDVMWGLDKVFKRTLVRPLERLHNANHNFFDVRMPLWLGVALQAAVAGSLWAWLTLR